ncbi:MAG TPA: DUF1015 domain-containing protein [Trebonia sp.]|nr:DUF1015 domain-containing protein [Trebonia sp.]
MAPFRGVRYIPHRASGIANVTSPPYDVIGTTTLDELLLADPHNVVRLILPARTGPDSDAGEGQAGGEGRSAGDANAQAARRLHEWLDAGILTPDPEPSLYVYEQSLPDGLLQRGVIALVQVGDPVSSGISPHEDVLPGPVRDRCELMAATRANLEPIFLVYEGGCPPRGGTSWLTDHVAATRPPLVTAETPDGITHRLWRLADPAEHAAVVADLATRTALIADGHHRYAAYRELRDAMHAAGHGSGGQGGRGEQGAPWDYGLAFLVDADAYPPALGAIHRMIPGLAADRACRLAEQASFTVRSLPGIRPGDTSPEGLGHALRLLAKAGQDGPAFLLAGDTGWWLATGPDPALVDAAMPAGASPQWRGLDAAILQRVLLPKAWGITDNEDSVLVCHDPAEAVATAVAAKDGLAVLLNPVPFGIVRNIARHGECVPRKSTSFGPKPRSGLVLRGFDF